MKTTLSFHATRQDVLELIAPWVSEFQLTLAFEQFFPRYQIASVDALAYGVDGFDPVGSLDRLSLHLGEVDPKVDSSVSFIDRNPDGLSIALGREDGRGLRVSRLGAGTDVEPAARIWKKLRDRARKSMGKGAWVLNLESGSRVRDDTHLYLPGARKLQEQGIPILGPSDWIRYELG